MCVFCKLCAHKFLFLYVYIYIYAENTDIGVQLRYVVDKCIHNAFTLINVRSMSVIIYICVCVYVSAFYIGTILSTNAADKTLANT